MAMTAAEILAVDDTKLVSVSVPEWGGDVFIRVMPLGERDSYERMWVGKRDTGIENFRAEYLARTLCDAKGSLLFTHSQVSDIALKSGSVMGRLFDEAMKLNAMTEEAVVEAGKS